MVVVAKESVAVLTERKTQITMNERVCTDGQLHDSDSYDEYQGIEDYK